MIFIDNNLPSPNPGSVPDSLLEVQFNLLHPDQLRQVADPNPNPNPNPGPMQAGAWSGPDAQLRGRLYSLCKATQLGPGQGHGVRAEAGKRVIIRVGARAGLVSVLG